MSVKGFLPKVGSKESADAKSSSIKFYREPKPKNMMPGLAKDDTEWDTISEFYGADTPSELKEKMFQFVHMTNIGEITIAAAKGKETKKEK